MRRVVFDIEEWRDSPIFPDRYEVSNHGNVRSKPYLKVGKNNSGSFAFTTKGRPMKIGSSVDGYAQVDLSKDGERVGCKVHRLVAEAFINNPENKPTVNHKDSDRKNNRVENLEWATYTEQSRHAFDYGKKTTLGESHPRAILNDSLVRQIKLLQAEKCRCVDIAEDLNLNYHTVWKVMSGDNWKHVEELCGG